MDEPQVIANYLAVPEHWVDMPEAHPRARCRAVEGAAPQPVSVLDDRTVVYDPESVIIDRYEDEKYADVRAEGEARYGKADS